MSGTLVALSHFVIFPPIDQILNNQRTTVRLATCLQARLFLRDETALVASVADLSTEGMAVEATGSEVGEALSLRRWLAPGVVIHVGLELVGKPLVLEGRVAWVHRSVHGTVRAGIHFERLQPSTRRVVVTWFSRALDILTVARPES